MAISTPDTESPGDARHDRLPRFAIGHVSMAAGDIGTLAAFYSDIGMRMVADLGRMAILELRGGTHLVLSQGEPGRATLDLMVDDIDETREVLDSAGAGPSAIQRGNPHDRFTASDPEGNTLVVSSSHAIGLV